jgi:hypothetical protein
MVNVIMLPQHYMDPGDLGFDGRQERLPQHVLRCVVRNDSSIHNSVQDSLAGRQMIGCVGKNPWLLMGPELNEHWRS